MRCSAKRRSKRNSRASRLRPDAARGDALEKIADRAQLRVRSRSVRGDRLRRRQRGLGRASGCAKSSRRTTSSTSPRSPQPAPARRVARSTSGIRIAGVDDVLVRLSKCCCAGAGRSDHGLRHDRTRRFGPSRRLSERRLYERRPRTHSRSAHGPTRPTSRTRSTSRSKPATGPDCCKTSWACAPR